MACARSNKFFSTNLSLKGGFHGTLGTPSKSATESGTVAYRKSLWVTSCMSIYSPSAIIEGDTEALKEVLDV